MTKENLKLSLKRVLSDRPFMVLMAGLILTGIIYGLVLGFSIQPRDVQVYIRHTSFGEAHFYKNPWQYTLLFAFFGPLVTVVHGALMVKLHNLDRKQTALLVGWLGIVVLFIAAVYSLSIMRLAFR